jgi:5,6-dimethylbenzimidazole synthase
MTETVATTPDYDLLLDIITRRASVRRLKPDPIPDEYIEMVIEAGHWAMSGANSQPWEYIVVKEPATKQALFRAFSEINADFIYWMEQQRLPELRHPAYQMTAEDSVQKARLSRGWSDAPALIVVLGDGRRQWGTVQGAMTFGRDQSHLTDSLANTCTLMHLAAASLGLGTQWVTIHIQEPFKRILEVPDLLMLYLIIPIGYPAVEPIRGVRRPLSEIVHREKYEMSKYMSNERIIEYLYELRGKTIDKYRQSWVGDNSPRSQ